jgi:hypothetical protein
MPIGAAHGKPNTRARQAGWSFEADPKGNRRSPQPGFTRGAVRSHCGRTMQAGPAIDQNHEDGKCRPREAVGRALRGEATTVVPAGPLAVHFCARLAGITIREYSTNAGALAESVIRYHDRFRPDAVWVSADTWVSAEAMGATVIAPDSDQPLCGSGEPRVRTARDIDRLPSPDPGSQGRYPVMLEALERVRRAVGSEAFVVACFDQYPFSLAGALLGLDQLMLRLRDDPPSCGVSWNVAWNTVAPTPSRWAPPAPTC